MVRPYAKRLDAAVHQRCVFQYHSGHRKMFN